jgi:hypothetical protein
MAQLALQVPLAPLVLPVLPAHKAQPVPLALLEQPVPLAHRAPLVLLAQQVLKGQSD